MLMVMKMLNYSSLFSYSHDNHSKDEEILLHYIFIQTLLP
jgi:hypothetical protein